MKKILPFVLILLLCVSVYAVQTVQTDEEQRNEIIRNANTCPDKEKTIKGLVYLEDGSNNPLPGIELKIESDCDPERVKYDNVVSDLNGD